MKDRVLTKAEADLLPAPEVGELRIPLLNGGVAIRHILPVDMGDLKTIWRVARKAGRLAMEAHR